MTCAVQQKSNEDPSEFSERIYQAYQEHTDADPPAPECLDAEMTFAGKSALALRKLQHLGQALRMNSS